MKTWDWELGHILHVDIFHFVINPWESFHISIYSDVIMSVMSSQITSLTIVYSTVYSGTDQRKHLSSTSLAFVRGIHQSLVNSPHKVPVMWKMLPFEDVIMLMPWETFYISYNCSRPMNQPSWRIWVNKSSDATRNWWYNQNETNHNKTKCLFYGIYFNTEPVKFKFKIVIVSTASNPRKV